MSLPLSFFRLTSPSSQPLIWKMLQSLSLFARLQYIRASVALKCLEWDTELWVQRMEHLWLVGAFLPNGARMLLVRVMLSARLICVPQARNCWAVACWSLCRSSRWSWTDPWRNTVKPKNKSHLHSPSLGPGYLTCGKLGAKYSRLCLLIPWTWCVECSASDLWMLDFQVNASYGWRGWVLCKQ